MAKCVYEVTEKTFFGGILYEPNGKRPYIVTEEPLKKVPAHLKLLRKKAEVDAALGSQSDPEARPRNRLSMRLSWQLLKLTLVGRKSCNGSHSHPQD